MRRTSLAAAALTLSLLTACSGSDPAPTSPATSSGASAQHTDATATVTAQLTGTATSEPDENAEFTFALNAFPQTLDALYARDGSTVHVVNQIVQGLVGVRPGRADLQPILATSWKSSSDGLVWSFSLRPGVRFSDGTAFDASAVCANLRRQADQLPEVRGGPAHTYADLVGFDSASRPSLITDCLVVNASQAVLVLSRPSADFPAVLALPALAMQSPAALRKGHANDVSVTPGGYVYPAYSRAPVGTGPFRLTSYDPVRQRIVLSRNRDYWGEPPRPAKLIFPAIAGEEERRRALDNGRIDGYDLPEPHTWNQLRDNENQVLLRAPFNVLYLGLNPARRKELADLAVRQALYRALDRNRLVTTVLPDGSTVATQFVPEAVTGYNPGIQAVAYDALAARDGLAAADASGLRLRLAYPTGVVRSYLPDPQIVAAALARDLRAVGLEVSLVPVAWTDYLRGIDAGRYDAWLLGWTGAVDSANDFLAHLFGPRENDFHTWDYGSGQTLSRQIADADAVVDGDDRRLTYQALNQKIMEDDLPALPLATVPTAIVLGPGAGGVAPNPLGLEDFAGARS